MNLLWKTLLCLLLGSTPVLAQDCFVPCPPGTYCPAANIVAEGIPLYQANDLHGQTFSNYSAFTDLSFPEAQFCGTIENNQWIGFVATDASMEITLTPLNGGEGIQGLILLPNGDCTFSSVISNCESPGASVPIVLTPDGLVPGAAYVIMTDGFGGSTHDYLVEVSPLPAPAGTDTLALCAGDTLFVHNDTLTQTGDYAYTLPGGATNGGDSLLTLTVEVLLPGVLDSTVLLFCGDTCLTWSDTTFCGAGSHTYTLAGQSANGCDSLIRLTLAVDTTTFATDLGEWVLCPGECFNYAGADYCASGTYAVTLTSANGCDSLVQFQVVELPASTGSLDATVCAGETFTFDGEHYAAPGSYTLLLSGAALGGCDSTLELTLTAAAPAETYLERTLCSGSCTSVADTSICDPGLYEFAFPGQSYLGCDSTLYLLVTAEEVITTDLGEFFICSEDCFPYNGTDYCDFGDYEVLFSGAGGCDSLVQFRVSLAADQVGNLTVTVCNDLQYDYGGVTYAVPGVYELLLPDAASNGCDSVLTLTLLNGAITVQYDTTTICPNECFMYGEVLVCGPGTYPDIVSPVGCDTVTYLVVEPSAVTSVIDAPGGTTLGGSVNALPLDGSGSIGVQYEWWHLNGAVFSTDPTILVELPGWYHLRVTGADGCQVVSSIRIYSVADLSSDYEHSTHLKRPTETPWAEEAEETISRTVIRVQLQPNPTTGRFRIVSPAWTPRQLRILDVRGQTHYEGSFHPEPSVALPSGVYFVELFDAAQRTVLRLVVN